MIDWIILDRLTPILILWTILLVSAMTNAIFHERPIEYVISLLRVYGIWNWIKVSGIRKTIFAAIGLITIPTLALVDIYF